MKYQKGTFIVLPNRQHLWELSLGARAVFVELCSFADDDGVCFPSRKLLSERIKMSVDSVDRFLTELEWSELIIKKLRRDEFGDQSSNEYQIVIKEADLRRGGGMDAATPSRTGAALTIPTLLTKEDLSEERKKIEPSGKKGNQEYEKALRWAESRRGFPFIYRTKQYKALAEAIGAGISISRLKNRWIDLEGEEWRDGFDWISVLNSFDKKA
jgi:hypothetical protein